MAWNIGPIEQLKMDTISLKIEANLASNDHQVRIQINGSDWLGYRLGLDPPRFFSQSALTQGGEALVGRCACGEEGCDPIAAVVVVKDNEVLWEVADVVTVADVPWQIAKEYTLHFEKASYLMLIASAANDFSWEDDKRTAERLVENIFKETTLTNGYRFDGASARIKQDKILLVFSKNRRQKFVDFGWVDASPETAVASAKQVKTELLEQRKRLRSQP